MIREIVPVLALGLMLSACDAPDVPNVTADQAASAETTEMKSKTTKQYEVTKSEAQWREQLSEQQYDVLREKGTERAFTGELWDNKEAGTYTCAGCGQPLYSSETKFESGTGWPSFWAPVSETAVDTADDSSWFSRRTELLCSRCGGHLGHVFNDGPKPTGMRHCINSTALTFVPEE